MSDEIVIRPPRPGFTDEPDPIVIRPPRPGVAADVPALVRGSERVKLDHNPNGAPLYELRHEGAPLSLVLASGDEQGSIVVRAVKGELPPGIASIPATLMGLDALARGVSPILWASDADRALTGESDGKATPERAVFWGGRPLVMTAEWHPGLPADG